MIDERSSKPYWDGRLITTPEGRVLSEVVSMPFDGNDFKQFTGQYERCVVRMIKEVIKHKDAKYILKQLINPTS